MKLSKKVVWVTVVAALGYFVDIYDLILFNVIKKESLMALGCTLESYRHYEISIFNYQMTGMLIGGLIWGVLGDKRGRVMVLFGSILLYSVANIANAFVTDLEWYKVLRFIAGVGLAGELGAGVTLVSETMGKENRGIGTMLIVTFGALGAVVASTVGNEGDFFNTLFKTNLQNWQIAYIIGGVMGLMLLLLRTTKLESAMFQSMSEQKINKGSLKQLFTTTHLRNLYLACIAIGVPIWFIVGVLMALSDRFSMYNSGINISVSTAIMWTYIGLSVGDLLSGLLSQWLKSRVKVIHIYLGFSFAMMLIFLFATNQNENFYYTMAFLLGIGTGYWALFVVNSTEQFGTNLRATVSTTVPNFVRGSVVPISLSFKYLSEHSEVVSSAFFIGVACFLLAVIGLSNMKDGFDKDLDYLN